MKSLFIILFTVSLFITCKNKSVKNEERLYDYFVFSSSEESFDYSVKLSHSSDTLYMQKRFPHPKEIFYSLLSKNNKDTLDQVIKKLHFVVYDTMYVQDHLHDGSKYKFYLKKDTIQKWVLIYGDVAPKELYNYSKIFENIKNKQEFQPVTANIDFGDLNYIKLPTVPPPPLKEKD